MKLLLGLNIVREDFQGLVQLLDGTFEVLAECEVVGLLGQRVETGYFLVIERLEPLGFSNAFFRKVVVGEDRLSGLKLHDSSIEILFFQQRVALCDSGIVGILLILAFLEDGSDGLGLSANILVVREDSQSLVVFSQSLSIFILCVEGVAGIEVGIENLLPLTIFLNLHQGLVKLFLGFRIVGFPFQCHFIIGFGTDIILV